MLRKTLRNFVRYRAFSTSKREKIEYDVAVVGGGPAGIL